MMKTSHLLPDECKVEILEEIVKSERLKDDMNSPDLKAVLDIRIRQLKWVIGEDERGDYPSGTTKAENVK